MLILKIAFAVVLSFTVICMNCVLFHLAIVPPVGPGKVSK